MAVKRTTNVAKVETSSNLFWALANTDLNGKDTKKIAITKNGILHVGTVKVHNGKGEEIGEGVQAYLEIMPIVAKYDKVIPWLPEIINNDEVYKSEIREIWTGKRKELAVVNDQAKATFNAKIKELFNENAWDYPEGQWNGKLEDIIPQEMEAEILKLQTLMTSKAFFTILLTADMKYVTCGDYIKASDKNVTVESKPTFVL